MSASPDHPLPDPGLRLRRLTILAEPDPGLLSRLIEPLAKRGLLPRRLEAVADGGMMRVTLLAELDETTAALLGASLRATVGVTTVLAGPG